MQIIQPIKVQHAPMRVHVIFPLDFVNVSVDLVGPHVRKVSYLVPCYHTCAIFRNFPLLSVHYLYSRHIFSFIASCPNDCSGRGLCSSMKDYALFRGPDYDNSLANAGDGLGPDYTYWDAGIQICACDDGFIGPDCSLSKYSNFAML